MMPVWCFSGIIGTISLTAKDGKFLLSDFGILFKHVDVALIFLFTDSNQIFVGEYSLAEM